jgi:hypothetical protein
VTSEFASALADDGIPVFEFNADPTSVSKSILLQSIHVLAKAYYAGA